jgi:hypothetical protein
MGCDRICHTPLVKWPHMMQKPIKPEEDTMTGHITYQDYEETYEYHGNVAIERIRLQDGSVERDWLYFDSTEEAVEFFNEVCA